MTPDMAQAPHGACKLPITIMLESCQDYKAVAVGYGANAKRLLFLAKAALRAPPEVAFAMRSWPLLLPFFGLSLSLKISFP